MATKWKNITNIIKKNATPLFEKGIILPFIALICAVIAMFLINSVSDLSVRWPLEDVWSRILVSDIFLAIASFLLVKMIFIRKHKKKYALADYSYAQWKRELLRQQGILLPVGIFFILGALLYFSVQAYYNHLMYHYNVYKLFTLYSCVIVLFISCEFAILTTMKDFLENIISRTTQANQKIIDAAIAAEKQSVEASIRSEKLKVDLISNVSHDLKTPLTSMVGYIDLMKKEELSDTMTDYVEVVSNKAEKLKEMIESLFSLAKTSSGNIELRPEPLSLNKLVEQICADMSDKIRASNLEFITELAPEETELITDSSYLYRICQNLVENALKYSAPNTRVFLKTIALPQENGGLMRFEITNTSRYRMNFTKEQIVERFTRGDEARTSEGNGLGLAIVNTYTAALGGRFDVSIDCDQFKARVEL